MFKCFFLKAFIKKTVSANILENFDYSSLIYRGLKEEGEPSIKKNSILASFLRMKLLELCYPYFQTTLIHVFKGIENKDTRKRDKRFPENKDRIFFENFDEIKKIPSLKTCIPKKG